ncbi:S-layer protein [Microcoleus sp. FACHB-831]|uniref:S-layer protein n=1 Tax=Microcoleus sp. FACHB-831 TaxID=2692827 RepID=UPI0016862CDB|nr:S-layer protein [Microcoleus sp. FACHB-831]MBD1920764.1 S-layer protein [Microcoleus sp. FACHB-831]
MKFKFIATVVLLASSGFVAPAEAQNRENISPIQPSAQTQPSSDRVLQACSRDAADTLPSPFIDVSPNDWAFKDVLSIYYCGAYRGSIPPDKARELQQQSSNQNRQV